MSRITGSQAKSLIEAYQSVYSIEEQVVDTDLEVEIFEAIAHTLISQGYTAVDVLEYFANVDDEVIIEDLISLSEGTLIVESVVSEEYLEEQFQQLDEVLGAALRIGQAAYKAAKYAPKAASLGKRALSALGGAGKAAQRVAQQGTKASAVVRPALGRAAQAVKGAASGVKSKLGSAVSKVKNVAKGALSKLPGGSGGALARGAKFLGKAALGGAAFEGGIRAVQGLAGALSKGSSAKTAPTKRGQGGRPLGDTTDRGGATPKATPKTEPTKPKATPKTEPTKPKATTPAAPKGGSGGGSAPSAPKVKPSAPVSKQTGNKAKDMETWAKANPKLAAKLTPSGTQKGTGKSQMEKDAEEIRQMQKRSQERQKTPTTKTEAYDAYDMVLDYLLSEGHADTLEEAHYLMMEMDGETIVDIVEEWKQNIAEAPGEWFGGLRDKARASRAAQIQSMQPTPKPGPNVSSPFAKPASRNDSGKLTTYGAGGGAAAERAGKTRQQVMQQGAKNLETKNRSNPGPNFGR